MTVNDLIRKIFLRLRRFRYIILLGGLLTAALLYMYARSQPVIYSVRSTVFPLTSGAEASSSSSKISELLGGGNSSKAITAEANVNIEEVARSKKTAEAVVSERLPQYGNKMIAAILISEYNKHRSYTTPALLFPKTDSAIIMAGSQLLRSNYTVKFNKNSLLEIVFSSTDQYLLAPVSYVLIEKISKFYKELKIKKAKADFDFAARKVDSLERVINSFDRRRVAVDNHTLFVAPQKLQYSIPKQNLETKRLGVLAQQTGTANNREDAAWRLQKETPIIDILDKPEPPYEINRVSEKLYAMGGLLLGCFLFALASVAPILYRFANQQVKGAMAVKFPEVNTTTTV